MTSQDPPRREPTVALKRPAPAAESEKTAHAPATGRSYWQIVLRQYRRSRLGMVGLWVFVALSIVALLAPLLANDVPIVARYKGRLCFPALPTYLEAMPVPRKLADWLRKQTIFGNNVFSEAYPEVVTQRWLSPEHQLGAGPPPQAPQPARRLAINLQGFLRIDGQFVSGELPERLARVDATLDEAAAAGMPVESRVEVQRTGRTAEAHALYERLAARAARGDVRVHLTETGTFLEGQTWKQTIATAWDPAAGDWYLRPPVFFSFSETVEVKREPGHVTVWGPNPEQHASKHWIGTDGHGRDVLARMIHGTIISLSVGVVAVSIYCTIGILLGLLAGYFGGWVDMILSRITEIVICFPSFFLIITVIAFLDRSIYNIMIVIGLTSWTGVFRLMRGEVLRVKELDYCSASRALGVSAWRIMLRHLLPNTISPVMVTATFGVASAILTENALSFLGFGVAQPTASWGEIVSQGRNFVSEGLYHMVLAPGVAIFITVTIFNLMGQALRDAMDPRLRQ